MEKIDRELLMRDMCSRIPYGTKVCYEHPKIYEDAIKELTYDTDIQELVTRYHGRCYLRPMSSMTDEEESEFDSLVWQTSMGEYDATILYYDDISATVDFLNSHHFDFRNLIERGLALEAPADMYNTKE